MSAFSVLSEKLEEQKIQLSEVLCAGNAKSYEHYKELCGQIRGLMTAQREITDLVRNLQEAENE
jgi:Cdc6-like AAA superfamily ATPase